MMPPRPGFEASALDREFNRLAVDVLVARVPYYLSPVIKMQDKVTRAHIDLYHLIEEILDQENWIKRTLENDKRGCI